MTTEVLTSFTRLTADDGMMLTDGETYAQIVCTTTPENWTETEPPEEEVEEETEDAGEGNFPGGARRVQPSD